MGDICPHHTPENGDGSNVSLGNSMKFSHKIVASSTILLLLSIGLISAKQYFSTQDKVKEQVNSSVQEVIYSVQSSVGIALKSRFNIANFTTALIEEDISKDHVTPLIRQKSISNSFFLAGVGYDADGSYVISNPNWNGPADWDPRKRPWYQQAKQENTTILTNPYKSPSTGITLVSIASPLKESGAFKGAVFYDITLEWLVETIKNITISGSSTLFIVNDQGKVLAHPDANKNAQEMSSFLPGISISRNVQKIVLNNQEYSIYFAPIENSNWFVGVKLNEDIAYASVTEIRNSALLYSSIAVILTLIILARLITVLMKPLTELNHALRDIASGRGDLTKRLCTEGDQEFAELATQFNQFVERLQKQISETKYLSNLVMNGTITTAKASKETSSAMDSQMQQIEKLATAMDEMSTTSLNVANNAKSAASAADIVETAMQEGIGIVNQTTSSITLLSTDLEAAVEKVGELETSTQNIESITKVINEIAEQTNLLALNAAIEAARAGESGRGFAVVADEVRTLAKRTQESTTEIRTMIEQLQRGTNEVADTINKSQHSGSEAVDNVQKANQALTKIGAAIEDINALNIEIASATEQQSSVTEEINTNTINIKDLSNSVTTAANNANQSIQTQIQHVKAQDDILNKFIV